MAPEQGVPGVPGTPALLQGVPVPRVFQIPLKVPFFHDSKDISSALFSGEFKANKPERFNSVESKYLSKGFHHYYHNDIVLLASCQEFNAF